MVLTGKEIIENIKLNKIEVDPFSPQHVGPNSIDLHLADELLVYTNTILDSRTENQTEVYQKDSIKGGWFLEPNRLYLGSTVEKVGSKTHLPLYEGRSSYGRLGIQVHSTAGVGNLGFFGTITLEITVAQPIWIYPNDRLCQVLFLSTVGEVTEYKGKYQNQSKTTSSRVHTEN